MGEGRGHEITEDGESTANWHCNRAKFWGTPDQFTMCARCGGHDRKRSDEPRHYRNVCKPDFHMLCDACYEELPS